MKHYQHINLINLGCSIFSTGKDLFSFVLKSFVQRDRCLNTNKQNQLKSDICGNCFAEETISNSLQNGYGRFEATSMSNL
jgi:hypothetical protein